MKKNKVWLIGCLSAMFLIAVGIAIGAFQSPSVKANAEDINAYYIDGSKNSTVEYAECSAATGGHGLVATFSKPTDKLVLREVIDLKTKTSDDALIGLKVLPKTIGISDYTEIDIAFVDVYDESNYLTVKFSTYPGKENTSDVSYSLAYASNGQAPTGKERGLDIIHVNQWGVWTYFKFFNTQYTYKLSYDYEENQIFAIENGGSKFIIADLDSVDYFGSNTWKGFTTGEVYCTININGLQSDRGQLLVDSYAGSDLSNNIITDKKGPSLKIYFDGNELDEEGAKGLPIAIVGYQYPLFDSWAFDLYSGKEEVDVKVYMNYYSSSKIEFFVRKDLSFYPTIVGKYYVVYETSDAQGNKSDRVIEIEAKSEEDIPEFEIALSAHETTCIVGESYDLPDVTVTGNVGKGTLEVNATNEGKALSFDGDSVRPVKDGKMTLTYTATDYVGRKAEKSVEITVVPTDKATFIEKPTLPKYFIEGNSYILPTVKAYNYVNADGASVATTVKVKTADGAEKQIAGAYIPSVQNHKDAVEVIYEATIGEVVSQYKKSIPVYKTKTNGDLDMTKFFDTATGSLEAQSSSMLLKTSVPDTRFDFINSIYSTQAKVEFSTNETLADIGKINIILTDYYDDSNQIEFSYVYVDNKLNFFVNGDETAKVPIASTVTYGVTFDNLNSVVYYDATSNQTIEVNKNLLGRDFGGFENNEFYVSIELEGVTAAASLELKAINGCNFYNGTSDYIGPTVNIAGEYGDERLINEVYSLPAALVYDVLDGKVDAYLSVYAPDGSVVVSKDGVALDYLSVSGNDNFVIDLTQFGDYEVSYTATDSFDNRTNFSYFVRVIDNTKPVITLTSALPKTVVVGSKIHIPQATVTDDRDKALQCEVYIMNPDGTMFRFDYTASNGTPIMGFVASEEGEYTIFYSVWDTEGNLTVKAYTVAVKEE